MPRSRSVLLALFVLVLLATGRVPSASAQTPTPSAARTSFRLEARYTADVRLDWGTRGVRIATTIDLRNTSGAPVDRLELNTIAARLGNLRRLAVRVDGADVGASVRGQTIRVPLPAPLAEGATASVRVVFRARLLTSTHRRDYLWTKSGGVATMYRFIPWLSREMPWGPSANGEPFLTPVSPLVRVTLRSDRPMRWATTGRRIGASGDPEVFEAANVRDFNVAASPDFRTTSRLSRDGQTLIVAHVRTLDADLLLRMAREDLARYERRLGPYPYPTYRIVEARRPIAMESPAMVWIPTGRPVSNLRYLIAHETAHQWFYGLVGNDQARHSFADEAMADYLARSHVGFLRGSTCPTDRLDRHIHDYREACYYETIYVQGALFLARVRRDFGDEAFWSALRSYARDHRLGIATTRDLLEHLRAETGNGILPRLRERFPSLY